MRCVRKLKANGAWGLAPRRPRANARWRTDTRRRHDDRDEADAATGGQVKGAGTSWREVPGGGAVNRTHPRANLQS